MSDSHKGFNWNGCRFITFDDDSSVERVFGAGRMHTIGGKQVEIKPATPRGSGPAGMVMGPRTFPAVMPGRGTGRGYGEMGPMAGGFSRPYAGMVPYTVGGRMPPMVSPISTDCSTPFQESVLISSCVMCSPPNLVHKSPHR